MEDKFLPSIHPAFRELVQNLSKAISQSNGFSETTVSIRVKQQGHNEYVEQELVLTGHPGKGCIMEVRDLEHKTVKDSEKADK